MGPATVGLAAVQVNIFVNTIFASQQPGAVSWLEYAFRILYLPIGIFGVAVGTVVTTRLAHSAAAADMGGMRGTLQESLRLLFFLTLPATAGLVVLSRPIVRLLYERGRFSAGDTDATAAALALYAVGLVAYTAVKVLAPAFYSLGRPRVPLIASASAVATNILFILSFHQTLTFRAIALGTALGSVVNCVVLALTLETRVGGFLRGLFTSSVARTAAATLVMAAPAWLSARALEGWVGTRGLFAQLVTGLGPVVVGGLRLRRGRAGPAHPRSHRPLVGPPSAVADLTDRAVGRGNRARAVGQPGQRGAGLQGLGSFRCSPQSVVVSTPFRGSVHSRNEEVPHGWTPSAKLRPPYLGRPAARLPGVRQRPRPGPGRGLPDPGEVPPARGVP